MVQKRRPVIDTHTHTHTTHIIFDKSTLKLVGKITIPFKYTVLQEYWFKTEVNFYLTTEGALKRCTESKIMNNKAHR